MDQTNQINQTSQTETTNQIEIDYSFENFDGNKLEGSKPKSKEFPGAGGQTIKYKEVPLQYNYGTPENPIIDSCFLELPIVTSYGGIVVKRETKPPKNPGDPPYIKESYSMMFTFDLQDEDCRLCLSKLDELHMGSAREMGKHKADLGMYDFDPTRPSGYKNPVYYKRDQATGERIKGKNPSMWVKLNHWKTNRTLFTDLNANPIEWDLLRDVEMKMIPLLHIEKIYVGTKPSLQVKMVSAIVTDIAPINTRTKQTRTAEKLRQKYGGLADTVASQLASLRMEKQDQLELRDEPEVATLPGDGQMHTIPTSDGGQVHSGDNLREFLGGAPYQPPVQNQSQSIQTQPPVQNQGQSIQNIQTQPQTTNQAYNQTPVQYGSNGSDGQYGQFNPAQQTIQLPTQRSQPVQFSSGGTSQPFLKIQ